MGAITTPEKKGSVLDHPQSNDLLGIPVINQSSHGFVLGDVLRESADGTFAKAAASTVANLGVGLSLCFYVTDSNNFQVLRLGVSRTVTYTHGLGGSYGDALYLSDTAGAMATSEGTLTVPLGFIRSATVIQWEPGFTAS